MGLVATLTAIKDDENGSISEELNRYNPHKPVAIDGSLSEIITQALNINYSRKDTTTGEPFYGESDPTGNPPPGAGNLPNIKNPDSPNSMNPIRPTLESMQQDNETAVEKLAIALDGMRDLKNDVDLSGKPLVVYAIPESNIIPEEMNNRIDMYHDSEVVRVSDFVFVHTDTTHDRSDIGYKVVDITEKVSDYAQRGAKVYPSLESFLNDLPNLRKK